MTNDTLRLKIKQRLNKLDSSDYDNIMPWQIIEAFNKGQSNWCRRNLVGTNVSKLEMKEIQDGLMIYKFY